MRIRKRRHDDAHYPGGGRGGRRAFAGAAAGRSGLPGYAAYLTPRPTCSPEWAEKAAEIRARIARGDLQYDDLDDHQWSILEENPEPNS